jgi:hypothetical protein
MCSTDEIRVIINDGSHLKSETLSKHCLRGKQLPMPLGDDFDSAVNDFDGDLIVHRVPRRSVPRPHSMINGACEIIILLKKVVAFFAQPPK